MLCGVSNSVLASEGSHVKPIDIKIFKSSQRAFLVMLCSKAHKRSLVSEDKVELFDG